MVDHYFELWSGQTKDYIIGICCFSTIKQAVSVSKSKVWLPGNHNNVSECSDMSTPRLLVQLENQIRRVGLVQSEHHHHLIKCNLFPL